MMELFVYHVNLVTILIKIGVMIHVKHVMNRVVFVLDQTLTNVRDVKIPIILMELHVLVVNHPV